MQTTKCDAQSWHNILVIHCTVICIQMQFLPHLPATLQLQPTIIAYVDTYEKSGSDGVSLVFLAIRQIWVKIHKQLCNQNSLCIEYFHIQSYGLPRHQITAAWVSVLTGTHGVMAILVAYYAGSFCGNVFHSIKHHTVASYINHSEGSLCILGHSSSLKRICGKLANKGQDIECNWNLLAEKMIVA